MDLPQQRERVTVDGLGNIGVGKYAKSVDKTGGSGIIKKTNRSVPIDIFNDYDVPNNSPITSKQIIDELNKTEIGRVTLKDIENLPERINLSYEYEISGTKGKENGGLITIYLRNCKDNYWATRTIIHEVTHWKYGIGQNQWSECVCIAQELKHARNRNYLKISEKRAIVKAVKDAYPEYKWKKGGTLYGRKKW